MENAMYTIDTVPLTKFHYKLVGYTLGGSFIDGYIIGLISFALPFIVTEMNMSAYWQGLIGSSALMGVFFGALAFGRLSDKIGRQTIYTWHFIVLLVASALQFFVHSPEILFTLRLILGLSIGAEYVIGPTLLAEYAPLKYRGTLLASLVTSWVVGNVISMVICYLIKDMGPDNWRWMLSSAVIPGALVLILRSGAPESLRWLISHGKIEKARETVARVLGPDVSIDNMIEESKHVSKAKVNPPYTAIFSKKLWKRSLFGGIFYACQVLPFFSIYTFVPTVLNTLGVKNGFAGSMIINIFTFVGALVGMLIMDKVSRRKMVIGTFLIFGIPLLILGIFTNLSPVLITILFCMTMFFLEIGSQLEFVYPPEMFPTELRTTGVGFITAFSRIGAVSGTFLLPVILASLGVNTAMLLMAAVAGIGLVASIFWAPETRGISLEESEELVEK